MPMSAVFGCPFLAFLRALVVAGLLAALPVAGHAIKQLLVARAAGCGLIDHDYVETRQSCLVLPKRFPDNALDSVSARCEAAIFF